MKNDLATAIVTAIAGVAISYFVCNMLINNSGDKFTYSINTIDSSVSSDLASPNPELFNYKALNPTVEVYVGNCTEVNMYGECVDASSEQIEEGIIEEVEEVENTENTEGNNTQSNTSPNSQRNDDNGITD